MDGGTTRTGRLNDFQNMAGWKMNAVRRLSEDRGPRIVSRQPSSSKFRRQSVETARHWVHTKHWWKYSPPFLLFLLLLLVRNFPESRNSTLLDPVAEVIFISLFFVISNQHCSCQPALTYPGAKASKRLDCRGDERVWGANRGEESKTEETRISSRSLWVLSHLCVQGEKVEIKRIVVVSSWRSGSSLIGGLFDSHPGATDNTQADSLKSDNLC